ncbi:tRNA dimethylallyltransferase 9 isoform X1 [Camellia sinensis]|uniref:tRNA dimethylallyltransferase 9 isoform X1 n=1 Tax=Camellia sinensis TaxID=4442 RepID=UPI0010365415|nr:tRNA dimethylallyltransferase 9 isoform X1 [Camellia sinensis]
MVSGFRGLRACCFRFSHTAAIPLPIHSSALSFRRRLFVTNCSASVAGKKEKVIVISGPTGAGKSRLALELAKRLNGEIISADSVQVYRGLDVGSAKPSLSERKEVPHHLVDILHPSEGYSVGKFFEDARQATRDILNNGRVPIVTGGTGLYLRWYIYGKPDVPKASQEITSEVYSKLAHFQKDVDWDAAVQLVVKAGDPWAQSLPTNDWYRLRRSLEIIKASGSPPSAFQVPYDLFREQFDSSVTDCSLDNYSSGDAHEESESMNLDYEFVCFFLSSQRLELYRLIDFRCEDMLSGSDGILSEARWLLDIGLLPNSNSATRAIGYRQAMEYLLGCKQRGGSSSEEFYAFLCEFQKASRNFAKRQLTWFRNERIYHWIDASKPMDEVLNFIYDSYYNQNGSLTVPESLSMEREISSRRKSELKGYRTKNRRFISKYDCSGVLDWIRRTEGENAAKLMSIHR